MPRSYTEQIGFAAAQLNAQKQGNDETAADDVPAVRFTLRLLKWLIQGFNAKEKTVRLRVVSLVTEIIGQLDELEYVGSHCDPTPID